jgi:hypothetical protein
VIDDILGGLVGGEAGERLGEHLRTKVFARKVRSITRRNTGSTRVTLVRPEGKWPRYWRGSVVLSGDRLRWRPLIRRWRAVDLSDAVVVGWSPTESFWRGQHLQVNLAGVDPVRELWVTPHRIDVVRALFGDERWLGRTAPRYTRRSGMTEPPWV